MNLSLLKNYKKAFVLTMLTCLAYAVAYAQGTYGLPEKIQDGNILHCFNWPMSEVKNELPNIAAAGFGSVQLSPLQRGDIQAGYAWHDLYRPYDLAFKPSAGMGSAEDLKSLCAEAAKYGIKIIVDVVANHVDKTAGYHDTWWDANGRVRWNGGINYGDRYSITHGQLGDYGDVNSEDTEVCARGKAYVEQLKSMGVKGIRWDAAKHIGLPSEGCSFWSSVTSVPDMYHYGEILDDPGPNASIINEYVKYMSVTDNKYCNGAARDNGGIPFGHGGKWAVDYSIDDSKLVYWGESHDTYSNDEWSQNVDQGIIDRAWAAYACRKGATALYLARPLTKGFSNIKIGKGSTAFKNAHIAEVNKFRNAMTGKADYAVAKGNTFVVTRQNGGAVIIMKGSGNVSVENGGGYCPAGTYTDRVSGGSFTVTATTISGSVGSSGIAVIYGETSNEPSVTLSPDGGTFTGTLTVKATLNNAANGWYKIGNGTQQTFTGTTSFTIGNDMAAGESVKVTWSATGDKETKTGEATYTKADPAAGQYVYFNNTKGWSRVFVWAWNDTENCCANGSWPGDVMTMENGKLKWTAPEGKIPTMIIFSDGNEQKAGGGDLVFINGKTYNGDGNIEEGGGTGNYPATLYLIGNINDWNTSTALPATGNNGVYTWSNVNLKDAGGSDAGKSFFSFNTTTGTDWNAVNQADRYGAGSKNEPIATGGSATIVKYAVNINASACESWMTTAGTYTVTANLATNTVTLSDNIPTPEKPVVTASPVSGTTFDSSITVSLSVKPEAKIYYTTDGNAPTTSSEVYSAALKFTETTTLKTLAVTADGTDNNQTFTYTKNGGEIEPPAPGNNLITDYYKVNPNGQVGSNKTINMTFTKLSGDNRMCVADNAMTNWTDAELIAQGVARDVAGAIKGKHEYPCVDSYAIYAAYDKDNLYLGVQYVYTVWDLYGDGKLTNGAAKPYNMDGRLMLAFDLDPAKSMDGVLTNGNTIWDADGQYNTFNNGTDCIWLGSTKSTVGQPGLFFPTADGKASYDAPYCVSLDAPFYGCADGLLPSIKHIWGQKDFEYDPEVLKGNEGFVDLIDEIPSDQHTFYEWKLPLSKLGITEEYIKNTGIGVMVIDTYGQGATGSTPYDPACFDNAKTPYSKDESSSAEKEDKDVFTYSHARIGKLQTATGIGNVNTNNNATVKVFAKDGRLYINSPKTQNVVISTVSGMTMTKRVDAGINTIDGLPHGIYIVNRTKVAL